MTISPDAVIIYQIGFFTLNATILYSWLIMLLLVLVCRSIGKRLTDSVHISAGQNLLEVVVEGMLDQIKKTGLDEPERHLPFLGTLFLFIATSNLLAAVPGFHPPTGSLSTTSALALLVFVAVPYHGIRRRGVRGYFSQYSEPTIIMLPLNILGELSRTLALAVRLFGNMMSGTMIIAVLAIVAPLFFPVVMQLFGLLTGLIQAYIFTVLAAVFIASSSQVEQQKHHPEPNVSGG